MTKTGIMTVLLRLPTRVLYRGSVQKLTAMGEGGRFGMLPNHIDYVTALSPGVVALVEEGGQERIFGTDEGLLIKQRHRVDICVRRAIEGQDLAALRDEVTSAFVELDDQERRARTALARLESDVVRRFADLQGAL